MIEAMVRLLRAEPQIAAAQVEAYARLLSAQFGSMASVLRRRLLLQAIGWACIAATMMFAGSSLMLWGVLPHDTMPMPWVLLAAPALPAAVGILALLASPPVPMSAAVGLLREQIALDAAALRHMSDVPAGAR